MLAKRFVSQAELLRLGHYKQNPLEKPGVELLKRLYAEEQGSILSILVRGESTILLTPGELLNVWEQARIMAGHGGTFAELGVFRGVTAKLICEAKGAVPLHLFDTFEGLPDVSRCDGRFRKGMFRTDEERVRRRLAAYPNVEIHRGLFSETADLVRDQRFSFVHLDVDLYEVTRGALEFFYARMLPGGRILSHDYGQCEGVFRAFDEFVDGRPEKLQPMEASQVLLVKS
jgi:O-methyltransferase